MLAGYADSGIGHGDMGERRVVTGADANCALLRELRGIAQEIADDADELLPVLDELRPVGRDVAHDLDAVRLDRRLEREQTFLDHGREAEDGRVDLAFPRVIDEILYQLVQLPA